MELYYDLHIHSCLSPCGDDDMTPANIAGMAAIKGLDVIAVTDHNSCRNCPAVMAAAEEYGVLAIPGMEINTSEEIHAVCLIYNTEDQICGTIPNLLIQPAEISFDQLWELVRGYGGVMFPAHIDKQANSLLYNLGAIPPDSRFRTAEMKDLKNLHRLRREHPYLEHCRVISNSDAHYLEHIHEPELTLQVSDKTIKDVLKALLFPDF